jgi:hypothetical protein
MNFLSTSLRDEGGLEYKRSIVEAILTIINTIPEAKEAGMIRESSRARAEPEPSPSRARDFCITHV